MRPGGLVDSLPGITAVSVLGLGLLALGLGYSWFWVVFVVGFAAVVPLSAIVSDALVSEARSGGNETGDGVDRKEALDVLRERYARGELDEDEFERKIDDLLATESVDEARDWAGQSEDAPDREPDIEAERS